MQERLRLISLGAFAAALWSPAVVFDSLYEDEQLKYAAYARRFIKTDPARHGLPSGVPE